MTSLFDPGLQPERTELSWRRTCLALGVGSLVAMRILPVAFGNAWWVLGGVLGILISAGLWVSARRRYRQAALVLEREGDRARLPDGRLALALAGFVVLIGAVSLVLIVTVSGG